MKKILFASVAVLAVLVLTLGLYAQPAGGGAGGGGRGGAGGGAGGMMGGGGGGMMGGGGGMMGGGGGMMGGRGARGPVQRPAKSERIASLKTLETQIAALKAAIDKAPDKDPNVANLSGDALTKFMDVYTPESDAVSAIQTTLSSMTGRRGGMGGASADVLSELRVLANGEKAAKTVAKLDALIKEAQNAPARGNRGGGNRGGGMMGGGMMGGGAGPGAGGPPAGGAPAGGAPAGGRRAGGA